VSGYYAVRCDDDVGKPHSKSSGLTLRKRLLGAWNGDKNAHHVAFRTSEMKLNGNIVIVI